MRPALWLLGWKARTTRRVSPIKRPLCRLWLEALEDRCMPTSQPFSEFSIPTPNSGPNAMVPGPDGSMWFTEVNADKLEPDHTKRPTDGVPVPRWGAYNPGPFGTYAGDNASLAFAADGNLWLGTHRDIAEINAHDGHLGEVIHDYTVASIPSDTYPYALPYPWTSIVITLDSGGNVWYGEPYVNDKIGRIAPSTSVPSGVVHSMDGIDTEVDVPQLGQWGAGVTTGSDGDIWFNPISGSPPYGGINCLGHIDPRQPDYDSQLASIQVIPISDNVRGLTSGPDGKLWMTTGDSILRFDPQHPSLPLDRFLIPTANSSGVPA